MARSLCCTTPRDFGPSAVSVKSAEWDSKNYISARRERIDRELFSSASWKEKKKNSRRSVMILVKKGGKVWVLDRSVFLTIMMRTAQEQLESNIRFLERVSVLQKLPEPKDHVLAKISDLLRIVSIPRRKYVHDESLDNFWRTIEGTFFFFFLTNTRHRKRNIEITSAGIFPGRSQDTATGREGREILHNQRRKRADHQGHRIRRRGGTGGPRQGRVLW